MDAKSKQCPACGKPASGKFCNHCGASLDGSAPWGAQAIAAWSALGLSILALFTALLALFGRGLDAGQPVAMSGQPTVSASPSVGKPIDLASLTPRQAADRLFNRVMTASESGNIEEARRFAPMALQAYELVETLDNDARFHVALIHLTAGDAKSARVQIDQLKKAVPNHLLALMLEHEIAERNGNRDGAARAYKTFLTAYGVEIAAGRVEYDEHRGGIERFRQAAQAGAAAQK